MYPDQSGPSMRYRPGMFSVARPPFPRPFRTQRARLPDLPLGLLAACVSTGFGALQLLAPRATVRTIGMRYPPWFIRVIGLRDLALGLAMLARPGAPRWLWTRVGNDLFDCGIIAGAAVLRGGRKRRLAGFAAVAAGIVALDLAAARRAGS